MGKQVVGPQRSQLRRFRNDSVLCFGLIVPVRNKWTTVHNVQCAHAVFVVVYNACTAPSPPHFAYSVCRLQFAMFSVCNVLKAPYMQCSVQCAMCNVQCTECSVQC